MCSLAPRLASAALADRMRAAHAHRGERDLGRSRRFQGHAEEEAALRHRRLRGLWRVHAGLPGQPRQRVRLRRLRAQGDLDARSPKPSPSTFAVDQRGWAPCKSACPVHTSVQGYVALAAAGRFDEAYRLAAEPNPFPSVCGRICTHECETACSRSRLDEPVAIASLKRFVADQVAASEPVAARRRSSTRSAWRSSGPVRPG